MENPTHLGDGVYALHDGYGIAISVNSHENQPVVYFEPSVLVAMVQWVNNIYIEHGKPPLIPTK